MTEREVLTTDGAAAAVGPYSQGIRLGATVYCSGQLPLDPATGIMAEGIAAQTRRSLANVAAVIAAGGASLGSVVKTTVFLKNMDDFAAMNQVYAEHFPSAPPARSTVEVARLPRDALVEIEAIAQVVDRAA